MTCHVVWGPSHRLGGPPDRPSTFDFQVASWSRRCTASCRGARDGDYEALGDHAAALAAYYATIDDDPTIALVGDEALTALIDLLFRQ